MSRSFRRTAYDALRRCARRRGGFLLLRFAKQATLPVLQLMNGQLRRLVSATHLLQTAIQSSLPPTPEWADHYVDVYWRWRSSGSWFFLERGVFSGLAIEPGARVLELCSGDGFNTRYFYSPRASEVVALDLNAEALRHARRNNAAPNITYVHADIRASLPEGPFDNVVWDAAIEHFSGSEIASLLASIRRCLREGGVLSGYTLIEPRIDARVNRGASDVFEHHRSVFYHRDDLVEVLKAVFPCVTAFETRFPKRTNLYFWASDITSAVPFSPGHPRFTTAVLSVSCLTEPTETEQSAEGTQ